MTILFSNNASTTVAGSISSTSTTVTLQSGTIFPHPLTVGDYFVATFYDQVTKTLNEIVHVTNLTGNVATIVRGQEGTTPLAWNAGDIFANLVTAGTLAAFNQQAAVPVNTADVYVGDDVSTTPNHIICNTVPVPAAYALGMVFIIRVKNLNTGPTDCSFNGVPAILSKRTDGSDVIAGNFTAHQEYMFIYNGTFFQTTIMPVPIIPPVLTFYVRSDSTSTVNSNGVESNSGFYNDPADAFLTMQGAINTFKARYIATPAVTVRVADGNYAGGFQEDSNYVGSWTFIGNQANPSAVVVTATATSSAGYTNPQAPLGSGVLCGSTAIMYVSGFAFKSHNWNVIVEGGYLELFDCLLNGPAPGSSAALGVSSGTCVIYGTIEYKQTASYETSIFDVGGGGLEMAIPLISGGFTDLNIVVDGAYNLDAIVYVYSNGVCSVYDPGVICSGAVCNAYGFDVSLGGGIGFYNGNQATFAPISNSGNNVVSPGWVA